MILAFLLACRPDPVDSEVPVDTEIVDSDVPDTDVEVVPFESPAEAVDLDPDPNVLHVALRAAAYLYAVNGELIEGYAYNEQVPGPTLRASVGDTLIVDVKNLLLEPTTVHWHGIDVPWAMDGITWMQDPIEPGETATFTFQLTRAGTYWYHPHFDDGRQVDLGLYGVIVVEDPADPPADVEIVAVLDTWAESDPIPHDTDADRRDQHHGGGDGHSAQLETWAVNRRIAPTLDVPAGSSVRVRLLNVSNTGYVDLRGLGRLIGLDQGLASAPHAAEGLVMGPGDRAELEWSVGSEPSALSTAPWTLYGGSTMGAAQDLVRFAPTGEGAAPDLLPYAFSGASPTADPGYADIVWVFQGQGDTWLINGEAYPDVTVPEVAQGEVAIVELRNLSATEHPFHLHGMPFEVLSVDGVAPAARTMEDTVNVPIRSVVRLRILASNPGDWMAHCHIPAHAHGGMMTVLRVVP